MTNYSSTPRDVLEAMYARAQADELDWTRSKERAIEDFTRAVVMLEHIKQEQGELRGELWLRNNTGKDGVV